MSGELFIELFPFEPNILPPLASYALRLSVPDIPDASRIVPHLARISGGNWLWVDGHFLTDSDVSPIQIEIALDMLRQQGLPLEGIIGVEEDSKYAASFSAQAHYLERILIRPTEDDMRQALAKHALAIPNARIERDVRTSVWQVEGAPALALSIKSLVVLQAPLSDLLEQGQELRGLQVCDRYALDLQGEIVGITGTLGSQRQRLLDLSKRPLMRQLLQSAPDEERVVSLSTHGAIYDYALSALFVVLNGDNPEQLERFKVPASAIGRHMRLAPALRSALVRAASEVLKTRGIIGNAYNARTHPHLFSQIDFMPDCLFAEGRVRPYKHASLANDFLRGKLYAKHPRFEDNPIKIAVINALDERALDFVEVLRRLLEREFGFHIEMIKERRIKVLNEKNLESAVRVVEKEQPDVLLACFPNSDHDDERDADAHNLKLLALGKGIATQVLYTRTLDDADATPLVAMGILAKTGNLPFVLAEPLDYCDYVVGLGFVRENLTKFERITALARIYRNDGAFVRYAMQSVEVEHGESIPLSLIQAILPADILQNSGIILHHAGELSKDLLRLIGKWTKSIHASLAPIEIHRYAVPRLYHFDKAAKSIGAPAWGSLFKLSDSEAFVVASSPSADSTPQPLRVRVIAHVLPVEQAIYSVLVWTLLHYGTQGMNKFPVTIHAHEDMASWTARGSLPKQTTGDVPFWL